MALRIIFLVLTGLLVPGTEPRDVKQIILEDLHIGNDYALDTAGGNKKLILKLDDNMDETAIVKKKKPLFNGNVQVEKCENGKCEENQLDKKLKKKVSECTFEGKLESDPDSQVAITNCKNSLNIGLISEKANLSSTTYKMEDGKVTKNEAKMVGESKVKTKDANIALVTDLYEKMQNGTAFIGKNNEVTSFEKLNDTKQQTGNDYNSSPWRVCCQLTKRVCKSLPSGEMNCVKTKAPKRCGSECYNMQKKVQQNSKINMNNLFKASETILPKIKKYTGTVTTNSFHQLADINLKEADSQLDENKEEDKDIDNKKDDDDDDDVEDVDLMDIFSDEDSEEYEDKDDDKGTGIDKKSALVRDVLIEELNKIYKETENYRKRKAPKTTISFKSKSVKYKCLGGGCTPKRDNPETPIYEDRTIEVGVCVDKDLWNTLKEQTGDSDKEAENSMIQMVHSLMVLTETHMSHKSISKEGGFKIAINGISIWKDDSNPFVRPIHEAKNTQDMLDGFSKYAKRVNEDFDGYVKSYDMMILLTGAHKRMNICFNCDTGLAYVDQVCKVQCALLLSVSLVDGMHLDNAGALLAHEMGHMLGSHHDGGKDDYGKLVDCPQDIYIMTPIHTQPVTEWSKCSREQIDTAYDKRQEKEPTKGNCFYT